MTKHAKISNFQRYFFSKQNKSYSFIFFSKSHLQQYTSFGQSLPLHLLYCKRTSSQMAIQYQRLPPTSQYGPQKKCLSWSNDCSFDHKRLFLKCWVNLKVSRDFFVCYQQNLFADIKGVFWKSIRCIWSSFFSGKNINSCEKKNEKVWLRQIIVERKLTFNVLTFAKLTLTCYCLSKSFENKNSVTKRIQKKLFLRKSMLSWFDTKNFRRNDISMRI